MPLERDKLMMCVKDLITIGHANLRRRQLILSSSVAFFEFIFEISLLTKLSDTVSKLKTTSLSGVVKSITTGSGRGTLEVISTTEEIKCSLKASAMAVDEI